ncbi:hypothetical protein MMMB2_4768 [Mycobacterium marinum MB2]|nr:hypothetical protein MMMB2_4768 [Mycobacterium marinum MB2]
MPISPLRKWCTTETGSARRRFSSASTPRHRTSPWEFSARCAMTQSSGWTASARYVTRATTPWTNALAAIFSTRAGVTFSTASIRGESQNSLPRGCCEARVAPG